MKTKPRKTVCRYIVRLTDSQLCLILGCLSESIEEKRQPYTAKDRVALVRLHSRLTAVDGGCQPDYALGAGNSIVAARNPSCVIVPANGLRGMLENMGKSHG